jgi:hypothetical protein
MTPNKASRSNNKFAEMQRMAKPDLGLVALLEPLEVPVLFGDVAIAAGPPVMSAALSAIGPGAANAKAPTPTSAPFPCCRRSENVTHEQRLEK